MNTRLLLHKRLQQPQSENKQSITRHSNNKAENYYDKIQLVTPMPNKCRQTKTSSRNSKRNSLIETSLEKMSVEDIQVELKSSSYNRPLDLTFGFESDSYRNFVRNNLFTNFTAEQSKEVTLELRQSKPSVRSRKL